MDKIILIGTSGLSKEVVDFINRYDLFEVVGFTVNKAWMKNQTYMGKPIYPLEELDQYFDKDNIKLFSTVSWYNYLNRVREEKFNELKDKGFHFANLISPFAMIYTEDVGEGNWIHDFAHIGYETVIGNNNVIRMNTTISHYSIIGSHNSLIAGTTIGGHAICGNRCFFGANSTVFNRVRIGNLCVIGGGAVVKHDLNDYSLCVSSEAYVKQCDENTIERYISPEHVNHSISEFEIIRDC